MEWHIDIKSSPALKKIRSSKQTKVYFKPTQPENLWLHLAYED